MKRTASLFAVLLFTCLILPGCAKRNEFNDETAQAAADMQNTNSEIDAAIADMNAALADQYLMRGRVSGGITSTLCGVAVDTTSVYQGIVYLKYNNQECNRKRKSGTITLTIQNYPLAKWKQRNCMIKVDFTNFTITHLQDGKSEVINGTGTLTNETGGTWYDLYYLNLASMTCRFLAENISVRYDGNEIRSKYNIARRYAFDVHDKKLRCNIDGFGRVDGKTLDSWGQSREGIAVQSQITTPVFWRMDCGPAAPLAGVVRVDREDRDYTFVCTLGTDGNGNSGDPVSGGCAHGYKVEWSYKSSTNKRVFEFYR